MDGARADVDPGSQLFLLDAMGGYFKYEFITQCGIPGQEPKKQDAAPLAAA